MKTQDFYPYWTTSSVLARAISDHLNLMRAYLKPLAAKYPDSTGLRRIPEYSAWVAAMFRARDSLMTVAPVEETIQVIDELEEAFEPLMLRLEQEFGYHPPETDPWVDLRRIEPKPQPRMRS